jgi:beta-glucanase (GH16 family)
VDALPITKRGAEACSNRRGLAPAAAKIGPVIVRYSGRGIALLGIVGGLLALTAPTGVGAGSQPPLGRQSKHLQRHVDHAKWPHLIWSDDFNGPAGTPPDPARWGYDTGGNGWGNKELEYYTSRPANAELNGKGDLAITARAEDYTGPDGVTRDYTSARLETLHEFQFQYGLIEARIKVPAGQGLLPAFWTLGNNAYESKASWPGSGEIDTMEVVGSEPQVLHGTIHGPWPWAGNQVSSSIHIPRPLSSGFHIYGVEWEPERISFMLDGTVYETITPADLSPGAAWPFKHPFFLLLDLAVGGEWPGSPNAITHFPAQMLVDWIHVWQ